MIMSGKIYHERQVKELCAIHALNNLFQKKLFTKAELDNICENLSPSRWFNPHRSFLGTGNFDINVILSALQAKGYAGIWFDKRKNPKTLTLEKIIGFIINAPSPYEFGVIRFPLSRRHWYAVCRVNGQYYNLDSKLTAPVPIGDDEAVITFLQTELKTNDRELFIVVDQEVEKEASWTAASRQESTGTPEHKEVSGGPIETMVNQELNEPTYQEVERYPVGTFVEQDVQNETFEPKNTQESGLT